MAVAQLISFAVAHISDSLDFNAADKWDGYVCPITRDFPEGPFQGYQLNWGSFDNQDVFSPFQSQPYSGYTTNWGQQQTNGTLNAFENQHYVGYTTNWGQFDGAPMEASIDDTDMDTIVDHPKVQKVYYKLKGFNPNTQQYEAWVVSHNVTGRPSLDGGLFDPDPGRQPPERERDVFKTPPSGNTLVNIVIVGRWFE